MRDRSEHDPSMIRPWSEHDPTQKTQTATRRTTEATFRTRQEQILLTITTFPAPAIIPNFTTCCACQEKWHMNFTKCCTCHKKWHMNFTKCCTCHEKWHMTFTKWCTCQEKSHVNFTKCCTCHAKGVSWLICITYETSFTMCGATGINLQPHQILRLPRKIALPNLREIYWKQVKWHFQRATDPSMIRAWSDHDPSMIRPRKRKPQPAAPQRLLFALARSRFYWKLQRFPLRLSFQISPHAAAPATKSDTWTSPNAAPATKSDTWTPPNAAPAKKKWHRNSTKCCACHEKGHEVTHDYYDYDYDYD